MSRFGEYEPDGPADPARARRAGWLDFAGGAVLAMLAFPFPIVRASVPLAAFVGLVLAAVLLGWRLYVALTVAMLGRTPGMYLFDLGFAAGRPGLGAALAWALTRSERISGVRVVEASAPSEKSPPDTP